MYFLEGLFKNSVNFHRISKAYFYRSAILECKGTKAKSSFLKALSSADPPAKPRKVSVVGAAGKVGSAVAGSLFLNNVCDEIVLVDPNKAVTTGLALDLLHGTCLVNGPVVRLSDDNVAQTADSDIIVLTCGITKKAGQTRLDIIDTNAVLFKKIVPPLAKLSPNSIFIVVSNPCDVLCYLTWKLSCFKSHKIIGSGTHLDSARFRYNISRKFKVSPQSVGGFMIGEHGDSVVAVWSTVNIGGTRLRELDPTIATKMDCENWNAVHHETARAGYTVHNLKGYTNMAVSMVVIDIVKAIFGNTRSIMTVSTKINGHFGATSDIFLSLPCVIGSQGVTEILNIPLTEDEKEKFKFSEFTIKTVCDKVKL